MGSPNVSNTVKYRMWVKQKYRCPLCKEELKAAEIFTPELVNIDHIKPRSKRGSNALFNLQLTHKPCNDLKADTWIEPEKAATVPDAMVTTYTSPEKLDASHILKHLLWSSQGYACGICREDITPSEVYREKFVNVFQKIPPRFGGTRERLNLHLVHVECYQPVEHTTPYWVIDNLPELSER